MAQKEPDSIGAFPKDISRVPNYSSPRRLADGAGCDFYVVYYTRFASCVKRKISVASSEFA